MYVHIFVWKNGYTSATCSDAMTLQKYKMERTILRCFKENADVVQRKQNGSFLLLYLHVP